MIGFGYAGRTPVGVVDDGVRMAGLSARLDLRLGAVVSAMCSNAMSLGDPHVIAAVVGVFI
jgi:hypothetical protein